MRLTHSEEVGALRFRRYQHKRHGIVETLTRDAVVYVRPVFGLLKQGKKKKREAVADFQGQQPKGKRPRLGTMWARRRGPDAA